MDNTAELAEKLSSKCHYKKGAKVRGNTYRTDVDFLNKAITLNSIILCNEKDFS